MTEASVNQTLADHPYAPLLEVPRKQAALCNPLISESCTDETLENVSALLETLAHATDRPQGDVIPDLFRLHWIASAALRYESINLRRRA